MDIKILVLVDNYVPRPQGLMGEYGLSLLLEKDGVRILYDTGSTGIPLISNMHVLGVDPTKMDYLFLSHRHLDHTGGVLKFLETRGGAPIPVISHTMLYESSIATLGGRTMEIGSGLKEGDLESRGGRPLFIQEPFELIHGVWVSGEIPREWGPSHTEYLFRLEGGRLVEDRMDDDMALYIDIGKGFLAITGCGHAGVENIMEYGEKLLGKPALGIVGGLHLVMSPPERVEKLVDYLISKDLKVIAPLHCTGPQPHWLLANRARDAYRPSGAGDLMEL